MSIGTKGLLVSLSLLGLLLQVACETQKPKAEDPAISDLRRELALLKARVNRINKDVVSLRFETSRYSSLSLDPTEKGYGRIDSNSGFFLTSVRNVSSYLDGFRVVLAIGNPSSVRYNGFKLKVAWQKNFPELREGESDEEYDKRLKEYEASRKEKEFSFIEALYPGSWNSVSLAISPATAEELKNLTIESFRTDQISLIKR